MSIRRTDRDQVEKYVALGSKVFTFFLKSMTVLASIAAIATAVQSSPFVSLGFGFVAVVSGLSGLVWHYRRHKNAYAEHILAIGNASRFLAANYSVIECGGASERRRIHEELLRAFRSVHDTLPRNPTRGWRVALWAPASADKLKIIASLDISHRTELEYFMGTAEDCVAGLVWKAWTERRNRISNDAPSDPDVDHDRYKLTQSPDKPTPIGSLLCQIVCLDEDPVCVISIDHPEGDLFSADEDDARAAVAGLIAIAIKPTYNTGGPHAAGR